MLVVQDNNGSVAGANAYLSVEELQAYHTARGNALTGSTTQLEQAIVRATDYIDRRFNFVGKKRMASPEQTTAWPRIGARDADSHYQAGIPLAVKDACAEYALRALQASLMPDPDRDSTGVAIQAKIEQVGPIHEATHYVVGASFTLPKYPLADSLLYRSGLAIRGGTLARG